MTIIKNDRRPSGNLNLPAQITRADLQTLVAMRRDVQDDLTHKQPAEYALSAAAVSDTNVPLLDAANVFTQTQAITKASGTALLSISSAAGAIRGFGMYTAAALRWLFYTEVTAEGGANAGSNLALIRYNDAGTALSVVLSIVRSTGIATFGHAVHVTGPIATAYVAKTAAYTITAADSVVACDATSAAFTITLPTAVGIAGREYTVKKTDASANAVTVDGNGAQTIDGAATYSVAAQWNTIVIVSDGANWLIKSKI